MIPAGNPEQMANLEVLARLRLYGLVGRDHQQHGIHTTRACQHRADELLVTGHVHKRDLVSPMVVCANPSSIVMPRSCSSFSRSGSMPVSARTSALFP